MKQIQLKKRFIHPQNQLSQLARFSTCKTKLQNKQYHFKALQVESHDTISQCMIKNHIQFIISY